MTSPFSEIMLNRLASRNQAVRWKAILREVRSFSAHCCDINSDGVMGVSKEPVIKFSFNPNPVCLTGSIDWDLTASYAPGSTITSWQVEWDDTTDNSGADISTASGSKTYVTAGSYQVEVTIVEGLGKTTSNTYEINVITCGETKDVGSWSYASTDGQGVYEIDWTVALPDWTAINTGLEGDSLYVRSLVIDPATTHLLPDNHSLWIATLGGVYNTPNGGNNWTRMEMGEPSNAQFLDSSAATEVDLDWKQVVIYDGIVYVAAVHLTLNRIWMYRSDDYGLTWSNRGVYP